MRQYLLLMLLFLFSITLPCAAELEGDYELISGPMECPTGSLQTIVHENNKGRVFLFGSRHSWPMNMKDVSKVKEVVKGGCTYVWSYQKSEKKFVNKTTLSKCPEERNNGIVTERMILNNDKLIYEFDSKEMRFKCRYKKSL